ncbi:IclR family transcriptional regulator [Rubrobacter radiotolerans]|uniref:Glycerol operon regulatory protein n=1 Tax=Rubrobacter radiotolerans TaxID=42256 RepID=A0AB35TAR9_RUBRA|nr:IclR family transcriptional regulator [Rubrobacter radiotolerans]MDX5894000.1 IclR family transcriptional regulator [Rubrobacter radiotolerans]
MEKRVSGAGVQSLERALDILELLGEASDELGVTEVGPAVGLPNGTAHRLLSTLTHRGYVLRNPKTRKYSLGPKAVSLASSAGEKLAPIARPYLEELMETCQETSNLAVLDRDSVVYLDQVPAQRMVRMFTEPGNRVPPHATGTGKVLLAYQPAATVEAIANRAGLRRFTEHTITDADELRRELEKIQEQGYGLDSEEMEEGVRCVAAPVFGPDGNILAGVSISGPASRLDEARLEEIVPEIKRIAREFTESLLSPD